MVRVCNIPGHLPAHNMKWRSEAIFQIIHDPKIHVPELSRKSTKWYATGSICPMKQLNSLLHVSLVPKWPKGKILLKTESTKVSSFYSVLLSSQLSLLLFLVISVCSTNIYGASVARRQRWVRSRRCLGDKSNGQQRCLFLLSSRKSDTVLAASPALSLKPRRP